MSHYIDSHPFQGAFLASKLDRLADLIAEQGEALLRRSGVEFPARAISAALLIGERGPISAAEIATVLEQPHQLVAQRVELLRKAGVVDRITDPKDARRKLLQFTDKGQDQFEKLKTCLVQSENALVSMFSEINCDLPTAITSAAEALRKQSLLARTTP